MFKWCVSLSQNLSEVYLVEGFHVCEIDLTWVSRRIFESVAHGVATLSFPLVNVHVDPWSPPGFYQRSCGALSRSRAGRDRMPSQSQHSDSEFAMGFLAIPPKKDRIWMNLDCLLFPTLFTTHLLLDCQNTSHEFQRRHKMLQVSPQWKAVRPQEKEAKTVELQANNSGFCWEQSFRHLELSFNVWCLG